MDIPFLDKCPNYNLYISGFIALRRPKALQNCRITHIVSVLEWQFEDDNPMTRGFQHLHIPVDDVEDENLLVWFPRSNAFIHQALSHWPTSKDATSHQDLDSPEGDRGNGVLIHCAMGKSRSATVLLAYLLWSSRQPQPQPQPTNTTNPDMVPLPPNPLSVIDALTLLRRGRPIAEPNEGFMDQLYRYVDMGCPTTQSELESHKLYRRWMNKRSLEESLRINQAPDMVDIKFEDELDEQDSSSSSSPSPTPSSDATATAAGANLSRLSLSQIHSPASTLHSTPQSQEQIFPGVSAPTGQEPPSQHPNANSLAAQTQSQIPTNTPQTADLLVKCRRCRYLLARSNFIIPHVPLQSDPAFHNSSSPPQPNSPTTPISHTTSLSSALNSTPAPQCAHIYLHPLSWMRPALTPGDLSGKLTCPNTKCGVNIGKFAWQGLRCSCGGWVTPGFAVGRGKVDEIKVGGWGEGGAGEKSKGKRLEGTAEGDARVGAGVRVPPGMRRGGNL